MSSERIAHPPTATREEWLAARRELLAREKALTDEYDAISASRRRMPMVRLDKRYQFESPQGMRSLPQLFGDKLQLIVYHFMFDPEWEKGCPGCTGFVDALGDLSMLEERNTRFVLISRAPLAKLEKYRSERGWQWPWYSSYESDFNYDFHTTLDADKAPIEYNFHSQQELERLNVPYSHRGEQHGLSVFFRLDDVVYHTYSAYARGVEALTDSYRLLDVTPYGRQEDWEDSPPGWPQQPTYG